MPCLFPCTLAPVPTHRHGGLSVYLGAVNEIMRQKWAEMPETDPLQVA